MCVLGGGGGGGLARHAFLPSSYLAHPSQELHEVVLRGTGSEELVSKTLLLYSETLNHKAMTYRITERKESQARWRSGNTKLPPASARAQKLICRLPGGSSWLRKHNVVKAGDRQTHPRASAEPRACGGSFIP